MYTLGERFGIALLMKMGMVHDPSQGKPYGITYDLEPEISESILFQNDTLQRVSVQCARYLVDNISFIGKVLIIFIIIFITIIITIIIIISPQTLLSSPHLGKIKWF